MASCGFGFWHCGFGLEGICVGFVGLDSCEIGGGVICGMVDCEAFP